MSKVILIFLESIFMFFGGVVAINVLHSTSDKSLVDSSAEILNSDLSKYEEFTICFRVISHQFSENSQVLASIKSSADPNFSYSIYTVPAPNDDPRYGTDFIKDKLGGQYQHGRVYGFMISEKSGEFFDIWTLGEWHSLCWVSSKVENSQRLYLDGKLVVNLRNHTMNPSPQNVQVLLPYVMNDRISHTTSTEITDLNIWNRTKTQNNLLKWSKCEEREEGNLIKWSTIQMNTSLNITDMDKGNICKSDSDIIVSDETKTFNGTLSLCKKIGGKIMVANNLTTLGAMVYKVGLVDECKDGFFVGYSDEKEEGNWVNVVDQTPMIFDNWNDGEPDDFADTDEDCAIYTPRSEKPKFHDVFCYSQFCPVCQLSTDVMYQFDRMCKNSRIDTFYSMKSPREFIGLKSSKMIKTTNRWEIVSTSENALLAYTLATDQNEDNDIPFGDNDWIFVDGSCFDNDIDWKDNDNKTRKLNFHPDVKRPGMFCCSDGQCLESSVVCNGEYDCEMGSDESFCNDRIIETHSSMQDKISAQNICLTVNVTVINVLDVSQADSTFTLFFWMRLEWINPNHDFLFLNDDNTMNDVKRMTNSSIYLPSLQYIQLYDNQFTNLKESLVIEKTAGPRMSGNEDDVRPKEMYKGTENRYLMDTLISAKFICSFDSVITYPYGDQSCSFSFFLTGSGQMLPGDVSYQGEAEVGQYQISPEAWTIKCYPLRNLNNCRNCDAVKLCTVSVFLKRNLWR